MTYFLKSLVFYFDQSVVVVATFVGNMWIEEQVQENNETYTLDGTVELEFWPKQGTVDWGGRFAGMVWQ